MNNNQQKQEQLDIGPWWRQPWTWLLMLGPFVAIIGCIITMTLAFKSFSDQPIYDGGMKRGLVIEKHTIQPKAVEPR